MSKTKKYPCTLDAKHNEKIKSFKKNQKNKDIISNQLIEYKREINQFIQKKKVNMTNDDFERYHELLDKIEINNKKLNNLNTFKDESDYYFNTNKILSQYYKDKYNIKNNINNKNFNVCLMSIIWNRLNKSF